jgi:hypothetical protein
MKLTVEVMDNVDVSVNMGCCWVADSCKPGALLEFAVHYLVRLHKFLAIDTLLPKKQAWCLCLI